MLKMTVGKHHAASKNITISMDKNVTYTFLSFYRILSSGPNPLCYSSVGFEPGAKQHFFTKGSGISE